MTTNDDTRWRLTGIESFSASLDITLSVDTTAQAVTDAIEEAAASNGITLQRIEAVGDEQVETQAEEASPPSVSQSPVASLVVTGLADTRDR